LLCSSFVRDATLFVSVSIFHVLIVLWLFTTPIEVESSSPQGLLMVGLINKGGEGGGYGERATFPKAHPFESRAVTSPLSNSENQSTPLQGQSLDADAKSGVHLNEGVSRQAVHKPKPPYPMMSKKLREQGLVVVRLCVNDQGIVGESSISRSSGFQSLDQSALKTLTQWRFTPTVVNGAISSSQCFQTPVQFSLEG